MEAVIKGHDHSFAILPDGRCKCILNGHVFPSNPQAVASFISGKKYRQLCEEEQKKKALQDFEPYLTQSKNFPDRLYCRLTCHVLKKDLKAVEKFIGGKKYKQTKELHDKGEHELMSEPDLESDEDEDLADASEQTRQEANGMSASPRKSAQEHDQSDQDELLDVTKEEGETSRPMDLDTKTVNKKERVRPPRPKRRKHAYAG